MLLVNSKKSSLLLIVVLTMKKEAKMGGFDIDREILEESYRKKRVLKNQNSTHNIKILYKVGRLKRFIL